MTKEECAIVTLYTGVAMLEGDDLEYLYRYAEKLMERPVFTHELATLAEELKKRAKPDFINLCRWAAAQPTQSNVSNELNALDCISRQAAIDEVDSETVSTNPEHFKSSEKFIKFMDDADIASFGKWQWANGFNTALVATTVQLKKLPSAEPKQTVSNFIESLPTSPLLVGKMPSAQPESCDGCKWEDAFGYGECHHCKRSFYDMYEVKE